MHTFSSDYLVLRTNNILAIKTNRYKGPRFHFMRIVARVSWTIKATNSKTLGKHFFLFLHASLYFFPIQLFCVKIHFKTFTARHHWSEMIPKPLHHVIWLCLQVRWQKIYVCFSPRTKKYVFECLAELPWPWCYNLCVAF